MLTIGERIKAIREQKGISQIDLATKANLSKQTLYKYENNIVTNIPSDKIEIIADILGTTPQFLMGWEETVAPVQQTEFDDFEMDLISSFRNADPETQKVIINLLAFSKKMKSQEEE